MLYHAGMTNKRDMSVTAYLDPDQREWLIREAARQERSVSWVIRDLIDQQKEGAEQ